MNEDASIPESLPDVLTTVEVWVARRRAPTRQHVRAVLVALGEVLLEGRGDEESASFDRVAAWIARDPDGWKQACDAEMALAVTEHGRSADPRWLSNPKYDLAYTVEARHRLEARLASAERLGLEVGDDLLEAIARADAILAPYLDGGTATNAG